MVVVVLRNVVVVVNLTTIYIVNITNGSPGAAASS